MSSGNSRIRSTKSRLPALLSGDAYSRLEGASELREFLRRKSARIALGAFPDQESTAQYEKEWGRPQALSQEIKEVEHLIQDWKRRGGNIDYLTPVLGALRHELAQAQGKVARTASTNAEPVDGQLKVASLDEIPEDFTAVGGGFYREGHSIWELRGAEDEEGGYLLTRKREERAVDMRPGFTETAEKIEKKAVSRCASCLPAGTSALFIKNGQAMPVIIIQVPEGEDEAEVEDEVGQRMPAPLDMLVTDMTVQMPNMPQMPAQMPAPSMQMLAPATQMAPSMQMSAPEMGSSCSTLPSGMGDMGWMVDEMSSELAEMGGCDCSRGCACPCHNGKSVKKKGPVQGMEPKIEPASKDADAQTSADMSGASNIATESPPSEEETDNAVKNAFIMRAFGPEEAWGKLVMPTRAFSPRYMGGRYTFDPEAREVFEVEGTARANPDSDRTYGVPNPVIPYPNAKGSEWSLNDRVRLVPQGGGEPIFVSPLELDRYFQMAQGSANTAPGRETSMSDNGEAREHRVKDDPTKTPPWDDYRVNPDMPGEPVGLGEYTDPAPWEQPGQAADGSGSEPEPEQTQMSKTQVTRNPAIPRKPRPRS